MNQRALFSFEEKSPKLTLIFMGLKWLHGVGRGLWGYKVIYSTIMYTENKNEE